MRDLQIHVGEGTVGAILLAPDRARACYVMAHGAGAGMRHPFMTDMATGLARRGMATLRYQFPYMEARRGRPDAPAVAMATVRAAIEAAAAELPGMPLYAGGKSFGGRMSSELASRETPAGLRGLIFIGFPLHQPGKPDVKRAVHLQLVSVPMLFLQGTRDNLAELGRMRIVCADLGAPATLHEVQDADHSFHVLKRSGRTDSQVLDELCDTMVQWVSQQDANFPR